MPSKLLIINGGPPETRTPNQRIKSAIAHTLRLLHYLCRKRNGLRETPRGWLENAHRYTVIFSVALVCACGKGPLETTKQPDKTAACMQFRWSTPEQIKATCGVDAFYGLSNQACLVNGYLYVGPKPAGFNDELALLSIGHEVLHALGAEHK